MFSAADYNVFFKHSHAAKGMSAKDITSCIQLAIDHASTTAIQTRILERMASLNRIDANVASVRNSVLAVVRGERAYHCVIAAWQSHNRQTTSTARCIRCCLSGERSGQTEGIAFVRAEDDGVKLSPVFYVHKQWVPLLKALMFISRAKDYTVLLVQHDDASIETMRSQLNAAVEFVYECCSQLAAINATQSTFRLSLSA
jgi:hypothetical protein